MRLASCDEGGRGEMVWMRAVEMREVDDMRRFR